MTEASMDERPLLVLISTDSGYEKYSFLLPEPKLVSEPIINILSSNSIHLNFDKPLVPSKSENIASECIFK